MTAAAELIHLRHEKRVLREQASVQRELITREQEQITLLERELSLHQEQMAQFAEQVKALQERLAKASHTSHLPPSSDRFGRQPKSLRQKSAKKPGKTLLFSPCPDEVIVHPVEGCEQSQADLRHMPPSMVERRQVVDVPPARLLVREHHSEQKQCPQCQQITVAPFPAEVRAPVQYGPRIAAMGVSVVQQQVLPLARACEVDEAREQGLATLHPLAVEEWHAQFVALVAHADAMTPTAQAPPGTKGRAKQSAARTLLDRLIHTQQAVLAFLHRLGVPFDNTQAERQSRMLKVQHKVSGSFRSEAAATAFCRIRGYVSTLRKQGLDLLASLEATLRGHPILPSFQTTWVVTSNLCATQG